MRTSEALGGATNTLGGSVLHGSAPQMLCFEMLFNKGDISFIVLASVLNPVALRINGNVVTAFNAGTTNVLSVGNDAEFDNYLTAANLDETATGFAAEKMVYLEANTTVTISFTETGTAATTGKAIVFIEVIPLTLYKQAA